MGSRLWFVCFTDYEGCNQTFCTPCRASRMWHAQLARQLMPRDRSSRASSRRNTFFGRPQCLPLRCASATPALTRPTIRPRSNSANAPKMWIRNFFQIPNRRRIAAQSIRCQHAGCEIVAVDQRLAHKELGASGYQHFGTSTSIYRRSERMSRPYTTLGICA